MNAAKIAIRFLISLSVFLVISLAHLGYLPNQLLQQFEGNLYDIRLQMTMPNSKNHHIVIVDIDEKSLEQQGQWPWSRNKLAVLLEQLFEHYQINSLGFDMVFAEPTNTTTLEVISDIQKQYPEIDLNQVHAQLDYDNQFAESLFARNIVMGFVFKQSTNHNINQQIGALPSPLFETHLTPFKKLHAPVSFTANYALLQDAAEHGGFFDYVRNDDTLRNIPLLQNFNNGIYPALSLKLAALSLNKPIEISLSHDEQVIESIQIGLNHIPVDETASMLVPFRGEMGSFNYISATDIINKVTPIEQLKNKIVIVGTSAPGLLDLRATPVGNSYAGVEVHANALSGILEGRVKHTPDYAIAIELIAFLMIMMLMTLVFPLLSPRNEFIFIIATFLVVIIINLYSWQALNLVFNLSSILTLIAITAFLHLNYNFFVEQRNKRHLSKVFGQYIPSQLVDKFNIEEAQMSLTGENKVMTVFFADVRDFTTISESMEANELTLMMNEFLTPITEQIHHHYGTIDKYMGDAVMAFWGAPISDEDHANHAIDAAFAITKAINQVNETFMKKGWHQINLGIGLSSGEMNVGNMGSQFRVAYTVMGDTVNLGSRLEGLTKIYGMPILVNEITKQLATQHAFIRVDKVRVKGKKKPVSIYCPTTEKTSDDHLFEQALNTYWMHNFQEAQKLMIKINASHLATLKALYLKRINTFIKQPPSPDWDGSYTHTSK